MNRRIALDFDIAQSYPEIRNWIRTGSLLAWKWLENDGFASSTACILACFFFVSGLFAHRRRQRERGAAGDLRPRIHEIMPFSSFIHLGILAGVGLDGDSQGLFGMVSRGLGMGKG